MDYRTRYKFHAASMLVLLFLFSSCLTDSGDGDKKDDDENPLFTKKTVTITHGATKLIQGEHVHFRVTSTPAPEPNEWLVYHFSGPDTARYIVQTARTENEIWRESFSAGDWVLFVAIYDSTEFKALGELAPDHGSAMLPIAVRKITTTISAAPAHTPQDIIFHANSPEKDWIHTYAAYVWTFGDGESTTTTGIDSVAYRYDTPGDYQVTVSIRCAIYENDNTKYQVAADTLDITVEPDISTALELVISPPDTVWNTSFGVSLKVEPSLTRTDYPDPVRWVIEYGDGDTDEDEGYLYDRFVSHRYYTTGTFTLSVAVYNHSTGQLLAENTATVTISNLPFLQETETVYAYVKGFTTKHYGSYDSGGAYTETSDWENLWGFGSNSLDLNWNGQNFSSEHTSGSGTQTTIVRFEGSLSSDGTTLVRLEYTVDFIDTDYYGSVWTRYDKFVLEQVPLTAYSTYRHRFFEESSAIGQYVTDFQSWSRMEHSDGTVGYDFYDAFDWQNISMGIPQLTVEFKQW